MIYNAFAGSSTMHGRMAGMYIVHPICRRTAWIDWVFLCHIVPDSNLASNHTILFNTITSNT